MSAGRAPTFIALVALLGLTLTGRAVAAPDWLAPTNLSAPGRDATEPQVAVDGSGAAVAVWARSNGSETIIQASSRPAGGAWTQAVDLSAPGRNSKQPAVAIDPAGNAVAVWARTNGAHWVIQASSRTPAGAWTAARDISDSEGSAKEPQIVLDAGAGAIAVWSRSDGFDYIVQSAVLAPEPGSSWAEPVDLSAAGEDADEPQLAVEGGGAAIAIWSRLEGTHRIAQAALRPRGGDWESADDLSDAGGNATEPQLAVDPAGGATAVWSRVVGTLGTIQSAEMSAGGGWSEAVDLSGAGDDATEPQVARAGGRALAAWSLGGAGPDSAIQSREEPIGGVWQPTQDLTQPALAQTVASPQVASDPNGNVAAVWMRTAGSPTVIEGRTKPAGGAWSGLGELSELGESAVEPQVALGATGDGASVWSRDDGANAIVQAAGLDGAGPLLPSLSIPAAATMRQPVRFAATTFDNWSPIRSLAWSFGDGGDGAIGSEVEHTFANPGTYPISILATDDVGNARSEAGSITIYRRPNAGRIVRVRRRVAVVMVHCPSPAGCSAVARLIARVTFDRGGRSLGRRAQIGRRAFSVAPGTSAVRIRLSPRGRAAFLEAGSKGLRTQLTGPGIQHRLVLLLPARR
jgi:hypothetical protein